MFANGTFGTGSPYGAIGIFPTDGQTYGDGFDVAFSNQGPGIVYATAQNSALWRSAASFAGGGFWDAELFDVVSAGGPFHTVIENWESNYDVTSIDSIQVTFTGPDTLLAGQGYAYPSLTAGEETFFVPSTTMFVDTTDTIMVQDYIQNRFALATSQGVYVTRDAARLSATSTEWFRVSSKTGVTVLEFSADGNHLFIGGSGGVTRVSGLNLAKDSLGLDIRSGSVVTTQSNSTGTSGTVQGISCDPNNVDNMIVTTGGYTTGFHVYRCTNATSTMSCAQIQGGVNALPRMPVYDAVIDYNDEDKVIVATEWGVWSTDNAFSAATGNSVNWSDESGNGLAHFPVHGIVQQHLRSTEALNSGSIYLGAHGRGFYRTETLATSVEENNEIVSADNGFVSGLNVYPNPMNNVGVVAFQLNETSNTTINIYNLTGSLVKTIRVGNKGVGKHKVQFDASALSIGSYILSLDNGSEKLFI
jgi:hypothetical protein